MTDRVLDISEEPAFLHVRLAQLLIEREGQEPASVPLTDIAVVVVSHPRTRYSQSALSGLAEAGAMLVVCNEKRMPAAMMMPLTANYLQAERFRCQAAAPVPKRKRLWQQIVRAKIAAQGRTLAQLRRDEAGLAGLAGRVRSGDPANVEAQAARRYWPALMGAAFRRDREAEDANRFLNYGYGVLRAITARALCTAGLHPSFGLHHHNRYNAFALADDLMEPLRPRVDGAVARWVESSPPDGPLDRHVKGFLLDALLAKVEFSGEKWPLFDAMSRAASSLVDVYEGRAKRMVLPEV